MRKKESIGRAAIILMTGTILSKILGFVREIVVAYKYGAGSISDAFLLTNGIPSMIFVSVGTAVGINYIPFCQKLGNKEEQNNFTSNLLNVILALLLTGCIIVNIFPKQVLKIFAAGLPDETERYAVVMLRIVMFSIIPIIVTHLFQAYSQVNGHFHTTALFGVVTNIVVIGVTLISTEKSFYLLSIGTILANTMGMLLTFYGAQKEGYRYSKIFEPFDPHIKTIVLLTLPLMVEDMASSMSLLVDRNLASYLDEGTISGLSYGGTLGNIAGTMISGAIITATYPEFAKLIGCNTYEKFDEKFGEYSEVISFLLCPISMAMLFHAKDIVIFIFEHGMFDSVASRIVWESLICYAIGIIPSGLQTYLVRGFYAIQDTRTPVKIKVFSLICNIVLNFATVKTWRHKGIAISTSISYMIAYILLAYYLWKKYKVTSVKNISRGMVIGMVSSVFAGIVSFFVFNNLIIVDKLFAKLILEMLAFMTVYLLGAAVTNRRVLIAAINMIKRKLHD